MPSMTSVVASSIGAIVLLPVLAFVSLGASANCSATLALPEAAVQGQSGPMVWDADQEKNATAIIETSAELGVGSRGMVIAVATAIQESSLRNKPDGDLAGPDSRGLFQQRSAWGSEPERLNPATATTFFLTGGRGGQPGLLDIPGWQQMPLSQAAQTVQRSAHPDAYAEHEKDATTLVAKLFDAAHVGNTVPSAGSCAGNLTGTKESGALEGYVIPAQTLPPARQAIIWALRQLGTPYAHGDCTDPHSGDPARQCDCSSLVQQAYRAASVALPRTTLDQVHSGTAVAEKDLAAGDLIFIPGSEGTLSVPRHVGLYLGRGLIVHAPQTGRNVEVTELAGWQHHIASIRRPHATTTP